MHYKRKKPRTQPGGCFCKFDKLMKVPKAKDILPPDQPATKHKAKKNTRKWCKGKVGVHHEGEWQDTHGEIDRRRRYPDKETRSQWLVCKNCGKHLDYRRLHLKCGKAHEGWGYGWYTIDRNGNKVRKPYPCEEKAA